MQQIAQLQVGDPPHAGVGVLRCDLQAAEQELNAPVGLAGGEELEGAGEEGRSWGDQSRFRWAVTIIIVFLIRFAIWIFLVSEATSH